jgi:hypothetical protein
LGPKSQPVPRVPKKSILAYPHLPESLANAE